MAVGEVLHIAIAGAGISGLTAAIALRKHPNIRVEIYEQAKELREIGASIALGPNGMRTLERLGVDNALRDDIGFRGPSHNPMIYRYIPPFLLDTKYRNMLTGILQGIGRRMRLSARISLRVRLSEDMRLQDFTEHTYTKLSSSTFHKTSSTLTRKLPMWTSMAKTECH